MSDLQVIRLANTEVVKFGPDATYQLILGDDEGSTPIRAWIDGQEDQAVRLEKGDTVALPPNVPHSFRVVGDQVLRTLGIHASPTRIAKYKDGRATDARGYQVSES